jgi:integrase
MIEMLAGNVEIHILSKQMGNSVAMIERHYRKLTTTIAAEKLA